MAITDGAWRRIVGIVQDVRNDGLEAPSKPTIYIPFGQTPRAQISLIVRTEGNPLTEGRMRLAESLRGDLLDLASIREAIPPGSVVYLLAGLRYDIRVWREEWPRIMANVLDACTERQARLIFFDNVYMYGPVDGVMTEDTPIRPSSKKGVVRARIAAVTSGGGEERSSASMHRACGGLLRSERVQQHINRLVLPPLSKGKPAKWLVNAEVPHSLTYTRDCGHALPLLARAPDVWGDVWHLPTARPPLTGREFVALAAREYGVEPKVTILRPWMLRMAALFDRTVRELIEMLYQYDRAYIFESSKFERRFGFTPTPYPRGIAETVAATR